MDGDESDQENPLPGRTYHFPLSVKLTSISVMTSTGSKLSSVGLYTHCVTACRADSIRSGCPLIRVRFWMVPSLAMIAVKRPTPCILASLARGGHMGPTFRIHP